MRKINPFLHGEFVLKRGMGIFSWILLGLIAGALAKFIMPGKDPGGIFVTILIGIAGGIVGGFLGSFIGLGKVESFDLGGIFIATLGAIVLLVIYRLLRKDLKTLLPSIPCSWRPRVCAGSTRRGSICRSPRGHIQKDEAEEYRGLAVIQNRPDALRSMELPIRGGHFSGEHERDGPR